MKALLEPIKEIARFDELFRDLKKGTAGVTVISGCLESQKAHMIAGLSELSLIHISEPTRPY